MKILKINMYQSVDGKSSIATTLDDLYALGMVQVVPPEAKKKRGRIRKKRIESQSTTKRGNYGPRTCRICGLKGHFEKKCPKVKQFNNSLPHAYMEEYIEQVPMAEIEIGTNDSAETVTVTENQSTGTEIPVAMVVAAGSGANEDPTTTEIATNDSTETETTTTN
jgi:hypothetical protein